MKPATKADLLERWKPRKAIVELILDDDLVLDHDRAVDELRTARANGHKPAAVKAIEKRVAELEAAVRDATRTLHFQAMRGADYRELLKAHPPTDAQVAEFRKGLPEELKYLRPEYNDDTFPDALVAASCIDPRLTVEEVTQLRQKLNAGEWGALRLTAVSVNTTARVSR